MFKKKYVGKIILTDGNGNIEIKWQKEFATRFFAEIVTKIKFALISTFDFDFMNSIGLIIEER